MYVPAIGSKLCTFFSCALFTRLLIMFYHRRLGLEWAIEIVDALTTAQHIYRTKEFQEMADAVVTLGMYTCRSTMEYT